MVQLLINHGVDPDKPCKYDGLTPIFRACWGEYQHHTDTVSASSPARGAAQFANERCASALRCVMVQVNVLLHAGVEFDKPMGSEHKLPIQMTKRAEARELLIRAKERVDPNVSSCLVWCCI